MNLVLLIMLLGVTAGPSVAHISQSAKVNGCCTGLAETTGDPHLTFSIVVISAVTVSCRIELNVLNTHIFLLCTKFSTYLTV